MVTSQKRRIKLSLYKIVLLPFNHMNMKEETDSGDLRDSEVFERCFVKAQPFQNEIVHMTNFEGIIYQGKKDSRLTEVETLNIELSNGITHYLIVRSSDVNLASQECPSNKNVDQRQDMRVFHNWEYVILNAWVILDEISHKLYRHWAHPQDKTACSWSNTIKSHATTTYSDYSAIIGSRDEFQIDTLNTIRVGDERKRSWISHTTTTYVTNHRAHASEHESWFGQPVVHDDLDVASWNIHT